jgi:hypothetical protein
MQTALFRLGAIIASPATEALPTPQAHAKSAFGVGGEKAEYQKFCKIQEYAKQVMNEK